MPKLVSIVLFAGSAVFLILALVLALTKGALDVSVLDYYFVVLPRYLWLVAAILFTAGWILRAAIPIFVFRGNAVIRCDQSLGLHGHRMNRAPPEVDDLLRMPESPVAGEPV